VFSLLPYIFLDNLTVFPIYWKFFLNQAKSRNKQRARKVPEDILVQTHAGAYASMTKVINGEGIDDIDEISIVFNNDEDVKDNACDLEKTSNKWEIPSDYQEKYKEATKTLSKS
jgi:predicted kinase